MSAAARFVWLLTGAVWAARSLVGFADPGYGGFVIPAALGGRAVMPRWFLVADLELSPAGEAAGTWE